MKIAIPTSGGNLCSHFGHCDEFTFVTVDDASKTVTSCEILQPPEHTPGAFPAWVSKLGAKAVLAGGMGGRAVELFEANGVDVVLGCPEEKPEQLAKAYVDGILSGGSNSCNHDAEGEHSHHKNCAHK